MDTDSESRSFLAILKEEEQKLSRLLTPEARITVSNDSYSFLHCFTRSEYSDPLQYPDVVSVLYPRRDTSVEQWRQDVALANASICEGTDILRDRYSFVEVQRLGKIVSNGFEPLDEIVRDDEFSSIADFLAKANVPENRVEETVRAFYGLRFENRGTLRLIKNGPLLFLPYGTREEPPQRPKIFAWSELFTGTYIVRSGFPLKDAITEAYSAAATKYVELQRKCTLAIE